MACRPCLPIGRRQGLGKRVCPRIINLGLVAEWLGRGLQNPVHEFNSHPGLTKVIMIRDPDVLASDRVGVEASGTKPCT